MIPEQGATEYNIKLAIRTRFTAVLCLAEDNTTVISCKYSEADYTIDDFVNIYTYIYLFGSHRWVYIVCDQDQCRKKLDTFIDALT